MHIFHGVVFVSRVFTGILIHWDGNQCLSLGESVKKLVLWLGLWSASHLVWGNELVGVVVSDQGVAIEGALVGIVGSTMHVQSDKLGRFVLPGANAKQRDVHVQAAGFAQRVIQLEDTYPGSLELVLKPAALEVIHVVALPWRTSTIESAQPINVLTGEALRRQQASTLGDSLKYQVGVHSSYYGPVASSPIIRGLEGPRVLVTQNGLDAGDASRVGPDHAVATEASTARQIEILRGPATLLYGSGAIGGVVNIVDDRVPQASETQGEWRFEHNSVADDKLVSGSVTTGTDDIAVHADGFWRESSDYKIPGNAERGSGQHNTADQRRLDSSAYDSQGINLGASYLLDSGFVGISAGRLERNYGIPGHSHGVGENVPVNAELEQDRIQLISELVLDRDFISAVNTRLGYTNYKHDEIELDQVATTFANKTYEARMDIFHHPLADWRGAATVHYKRGDFSAVGAEAFTPPSLTESWALALIEERHVGELLLQLGGRVERIDIAAQNFIAELSQRYEGKLLSVYAVDYQATPFSLSAGSVWNFAPGYNLAVSFSHSQRAPSSAELLSFGPHIGSGLFEVGALLQVIETDKDNGYFDLQRDAIELEKSNNIDISLRKYEGDIGFISTIFYNAIDNYYFLSKSNSTQQIASLHGDHYHYFSMPVYSYRAQDADLYGFEGQLVWQATDPLKITFISDYIRAQLRRGGDLPRIPPLRIGGRINYQLGDMDIELNATHYFQQNKVAALETETGGYTLLDLHLSYGLDSWLPGTTLYLKGQNLGNEYARVHSSFLKDKAPLPARSLAVGISGKF